MEYLIVGTCAVVAIAGVLCIRWLLLNADKDFRRGQEDSPQWSPPDVAPPAPGSYKTRVIDQPRYGIGRARWDGKKWRYPDGKECYFQKREWQDLTGAAS